MAVVGNLQGLEPSVSHADRDGRRARVDTVLEQLFQRGGGPMNHLAGRNPVHYDRVQRLDFGGVDPPQTLILNSTLAFGTGEAKFLIYFLSQRPGPDPG